MIKLDNLTLDELKQATATPRMLAEGVRNSSTGASKFHKKAFVQRMRIAVECKQLEGELDETDQEAQS